MFSVINLNRYNSFASALAVLTKGRLTLHRPANPIRTLHHFACTGGTLISRCLAATPNTMVLSEIDPLSTMARLDNVPFAPIDILFNVRNSNLKLDQNAIVEIFLSSVQQLETELRKKHANLVLREHSHSMFCTDVEPSSRPSVFEMLQKRFKVIGVVTVRHPLDSFLSLIENGWSHFSPFTLDEYCRRYLVFLDRFVGLPFFKYETFLADPPRVLRLICDALDLLFDPSALENFKTIKLSGDSGRTSDTISERPRRVVLWDVSLEAQKSPHYHQLCERLGYPIFV